MYNIRVIIVVIIIFCPLIVSAGNFDTATIKIVEIERTYEFGLPKKDTVMCTVFYLKNSVYHPNGKHWYLKGLHGQDFISEKQPKILRIVEK